MKKEDELKYMTDKIKIGIEMIKFKEEMMKKGYNPIAVYESFCVLGEASKLFLVELKKECDNKDKEDKKDSKESESSEVEMMKELSDSLSELVKFIRDN